MSARRVSREPYRLRRDRREVLVAVAVAAAIVLLTAVAVWILAPDTGNDAPSLTPSEQTTITVPTTVTTAPSDSATTTPTGG